MPKFVRYKNDYWEWDEEEMILNNRYHGWRSINENSPEWMNATIIEANDWHDLYLKTGYTDLYRGNKMEPCVWVDPDGDFWKGDCHEVDAEDICEVVLGIDADLYEAGDYLFKLGWTKLSTWMFSCYCSDHTYDNITTYQARAIKEWCDHYDLPFNWVVPNYGDEF